MPNVFVLGLIWSRKEKKKNIKVFSFSVVVFYELSGCSRPVNGVVCSHVLVCAGITIVASMCVVNAI